MAGNRWRLMIQGHVPAAPPPEPNGKLAPSVGWTGVADSGFGGLAAAIPENPTRTTAQAVLNHGFLPYVTFVEDYSLCFCADAYGGIEKIRIYCEGNYVDVTAPEWRSYISPKGETAYVFGHHIDLDYAAIMALHATGDMHIYAEAFPINPAVQRRVRGPYKLYARAPGVGVGKQFDIQLTVDPQLGSNDAGVAYKTQQEAVQYCVTNNFKRPLILLDREFNEADDTTRFKGFTNSNMSPSLAVATTLITIMNAPGVNVVLGDYTVTSANPAVSGIHYKANTSGGIRLEHAALSTTFASVLRGPPGSNNVFLFEGVEISSGTPPPGIGGTGSGATAFINGNDAQTAIATRNNNNPLELHFKDVDAHDLCGYGLGFGQMVLNCILQDCSGSAIEGLGGGLQGGVYGLGGIAQGNKITRIGGVYPGLRTHVPAFTLTYTGAATSVQILKAGANGRGLPGTDSGGPARGFYSYEDGVETNYTAINYSGVLATNTSLRALYDDINANWANWTASDFNDDNILYAAFLSLPGSVPSAAIPLTTISPSDTIALTTIADVHANGFVFDNVAQYRNVIVWFNEFWNGVGTDGITLAQTTDMSVCWNVFHDNAKRYDDSTPQPSVVSRATSHMLWRRNSFLGQGNAMTVTNTSPQTATFDEFCVMEDSAFENLGYFATDIDLRVERIVVRTGLLPSHAVDCVNLSGAAETTMYADPSPTDDLAAPDCTPEAALEIADGVYVGARAAVATSANRGWNLDLPTP